VSAAVTAMFSTRPAGQGGGGNRGKSCRQEFAIDGCRQPWTVKVQARKWVSNDKHKRECRRPTQASNKELREPSSRIQLKGQASKQ
jgi:hypothetical protein